METLVGYQQVFESALLSLDYLLARQIFKEAEDIGTPLLRIEMLINPVLESIGEKWHTGDAALSQIYMSSRICEELVDEILPTTSPDRINSPKMAIAVLEDYHLLGKRIVYTTLRSSGYSLLDFGRVSVSELVKRVVEEEIEILLISTLMLSAALRIRDVRDQLDAIGRHILMIVGGAPFRFDDQLWKQVGADGTTASATDVVGLITRLTGEQR